MEFVLGLGTNMGNRLENLQNAVEALNLLPDTHVVRQSLVYETEPYGYKEQACFLNMAVVVESDLTPENMLGACLGIEAGFGRIRQFKNGPRILDIDVLLADGYTADTPHLKVPHPEIRKRTFVLQPLLDIFPTGEAYGYSFIEAYRSFPMTDIKKYDAE